MKLQKSLLYVTGLAVAAWAAPVQAQQTDANREVKTDEGSAQARLKVASDGDAKEADAKAESEDSDVKLTEAEKKARAKEEFEHNRDWDTDRKQADRQESDRSMDRDDKVRATDIESKPVQMDTQPDAGSEDHPAETETR